MRLPRPVPDVVRYLTGGERLVLVTRRHPAVLTGVALQALLAVVVAFAASPRQPSQGAAQGWSALSNLLWIVALVFLARFAWAFAEWALRRIVLTDRRVFEVRGVLHRTVASIALRRMTDMSYRRPLFGRILGYATFVIETAGQDQPLRSIEYILHPDDFYRAVTWLVFGEPVAGPGAEQGTA